MSTLYQHSGEREAGEEQRKRVRGGVFILFFFPPLLGLFPPFLSFFSVVYVLVCPCVCMCVCVCVCVCVYAHSAAHLNLLLITSHTSRLSEGLLTVEDYQAAGAF